LNPSSFAPLIFVIFGLEFVGDFVGKGGPNLLVPSGIEIFVFTSFVFFTSLFCSRRCFDSISLVSQSFAIPFETFCVLCSCDYSRGIRVSCIERVDPSISSPAVRSRFSPFLVSVLAQEILGSAERSTTARSMARGTLGRARPGTAGSFIQCGTRRRQRHQARGRSALLSRGFLRRLFYFYIFQKYFLQKYIFDFTIYSFILLSPGKGAAGTYM
jgi:hypothetical protein